MEDVGWLDGWPDHQWGAGDASGRGVCVRAGSGRLEGDLRMWQRVCPEGDPLSPAERKTGKRKKGLMGK